jgi:hypothetical protein
MIGKALWIKQNEPQLFEVSMRDFGVLKCHRWGRALLQETGSTGGQAGQQGSMLILT